MVSTVVMMFSVLWLAPNTWAYSVAKAPEKKFHEYEWKPVCASDGHTYPSLEYFKTYNSNSSVGIVFYEGSCNVYQCLWYCYCAPLKVCGTDGKTYASECYLQCLKYDHPELNDVKVKHAGQCKKRCPCPRNYQPVCGSNGKTYNNKCLLECDNAVMVFNGTCKEYRCNRLCPKEERPVCGTNIQTYHNACSLSCARRHRRGSRNLKVYFRGPCPNPDSCSCLAAIGIPCGCKKAPIESEYREETASK